jgi:ectoine hydroxylase-related dioxygenase (phytanoyl-CoA dioxygenase family)
MQSATTDESRQILLQLGVSSDTLLDAKRSSLDRDGYVVLDGIADASAVRAMRSAIDVLLEEARRDPSRRYGGTLHLESLIDSGPAFDCAWTSPRVLAAVAHILGVAFRADAITYRGPQAGYGAQALHTDDLPTGDDGLYRTATAILALTDFTESNGATRLVAGSHRTPLRDAPKDPDTPYPAARCITARAGDAIVFNGHLWHSGTRNRSQERRDALQIVFRRRTPGVYGGPTATNATFDRLGPAALLLV